MKKLLFIAVLALAACSGESGPKPPDVDPAKTTFTYAGKAIAVNGGLKAKAKFPVRDLESGTRMSVFRLESK